MAVSIGIEGVDKSFGTLHALKCVNLLINPGELFFLLGPSGCGKTTLLRCVAGFHKPDKGRIMIGETDVTHLPPYQRDTGMMFQSYALWPHMTLAENVAFGLEMRKVARHEIKKRVHEALDLVHLADRAKARPNQLSGGQQQRVALARALVIRPRCLLLDEPLSNLDAKLRLEMRVVIRRVCKQAGLTAIYVTHDQKEALSVADRLAVMRDGIVEQTGSPREVYHNPSNNFVAGFIGEGNFIDGTLECCDVNGVRVSTALGTLQSTRVSSELRPGQRVSICLRPESVRLDKPSADAPNILLGRCLESVYLGEVAQHKIMLTPASNGAETTLTAFELNPGSATRVAGETARMWIDPENVIITAKKAPAQEAHER